MLSSGPFSVRPSGDGGDQRERVGVGRRGGVLAEVADVFVVEVDVDEASQFAFIVEDLLAQIGVLGDERGEHFAHGGAGDGDGILLRGELPQRRRDQYFGHVGICRQRIFCLLRRSHSATDAQLCEPLPHRGQRLPVSSGHAVPARSRTKEGGIHRMCLYCATGSVEADLFPQLKDLLAESLAKLGKRNRVLAVPPDQSRAHSRAGELTRYAWEYYGDRMQAVLPALGTHTAMQPEQIERMFGAMPQELFHVHNWRTDVETLGEVPADFVHEQSEGKLNYAWPAQVNRLIAHGGFDLILSIGQ